METATRGHTASTRSRTGPSLSEFTIQVLTTQHTPERSLERVSISQNWETAVISGLVWAPLGWSGFGVGIRKIEFKLS